MKKVKEHLIANQIVVVVFIFIVISLLSTLKIAFGIIMIYWILNLTYQTIRDYREGKRKHISSLAWNLFYIEISIKLSAVVLYALFFYMENDWKWPMIGMLTIYLICSLKYYWSYEEEH